MATARVRLGELLVESQIITREQLEEVLALQKNDGRRLGTLLVESGLVTETQVTQILSQQLSVPWVSLYHIDFSRQLLNLVPHDLADKYCLVPIFVRRVRGLGETLYVAMDDPSDESAQREVSDWSGLPVRAMIAPPTDIISAIRVYYGGGNDLPSLSEAVAVMEKAAARRIEVGRDSPKSTAEPERSRYDIDIESAMEAARGGNAKAAPAAAISSELATQGRVAEAVARPEEQRASEALPAPSAAGNGQPASESTSSAAPPSEFVEASVTVTGLAEGERRSVPPDSSPRIETREISIPVPRRGKKRQMLTVTLLDGTQVNLPGRGAAAALATTSEPAAQDQLTARDLVAALRAMSHGADATEILGENTRWEALFAALLSLLLKKHLISDSEFIEEYKKF